MIQVLLSSYFRAIFLTVCPNVANDMALESLNKCKSFWYVLFLPILYGFKSVSKMEKNVFSLYFLQTLTERANNIPLKSYEKCETFSY